MTFTKSTKKKKVTYRLQIIPIALTIPAFCSTHQCHEVNEFMMMIFMLIILFIAVLCIGAVVNKLSGSTDIKYSDFLCNNISFSLKKTAEKLVN